jgi:hypothetical protein
MSKPEQSDPPKITLEDLLCFKRTERPASEFWTRFESELRQKQLAALVERESWWRSVPRFFTRFSRLHLPLGATAILALSLITLHSYRGSAINRSMLPGEAQSGMPRRDFSNAHGAPADVRAGLAAAAGAPAAPAAFADTRNALPTDIPGHGASMANSAAHAPTSPEVSEMIPWLGNLVPPDVSPADTPVIKASATDLADGEAAGSAFANSLARTRSFDDRSLAISGAETGMTASVSRRAVRLMDDYQVLAMDAAYVPTPTASEPVRTRTTRYLVEDGFEQGNSRLGAQGDRVSFKF